MAANLDLTPAAAAPRRRPGLLSLSIVIGLAGVGGLVLLGFGPAALPLVVALVAGFGLTYLAGIALSIEERLFFGTVVGAMAVTLFGLLLALPFGLTLATALAACVAALAASSPGWWRALGLIADEVAEARSRWTARVTAPGHPWPVLAVLAIAWPYSLKLLTQLYVLRPDGLWAGTLGVWGDWAAHLAYAGSFAYGGNFPPEFPVDPGHRLGYPFMVDFFAAMLVPLGEPLPAALVLTTGLLALALPAVMYLAGVRFLGSRAGAALAVFVFALGGGFGFVYFLGDLFNHGPSVLRHLPHQYTHMPDLNYQWLNPVLANLLPQRSTLFGFSFALIALALLYSARQAPPGSWAPFLAIGVLTGIAPAFHVHAYGTVVALAAFWAVLNRRREWMAFFGPALVLGVPALAWMWPPGSAPCLPGRCVFGFPLLPGWLAMADGHHDFIPWFWLKNVGLFLPALIVAQLWPGLTATGFARHFAPVWLWFLVPNVIQLHPWDWDNNKFFALWALLGAFMVGALLTRLFALGPRTAALAALLAVALGASGTLDLAREADFSVAAYRFTDTGGLHVAAWAREHTPAKAVFLTSTDHNEPIPSLGGRRVVLGYTGWLWSYGLSDWPAKEGDVGVMLRGGPGTGELVRRYHVSYVVIGPQERGGRNLASDSYWSLHGSVVYSDGGYTVYQVSE